MEKKCLSKSLLLEEIKRLKERLTKYYIAQNSSVSHDFNSILNLTEEQLRASTEIPNLEEKIKYLTCLLNEANDEYETYTWSDKLASIGATLDTINVAEFTINYTDGKLTFSLKEKTI